MSRPCFSLLSSFLCRDPKISVTIIKTPFKLEVCRNIDSPCYNQVSSSIKHSLSKPSFLVETLTSSSASFRLNKFFYVTEVSVATEEGSVATDILLPVQHYVATQTNLFPADLYMFFPFSVAICCLLSRTSSIVNQSRNVVATQELLLRHRKCCCDTFSLVIAWKFVTTHKFQSRHGLL